MQLQNYKIRENDDYGSILEKSIKKLMSNTLSLKTCVITPLEITDKEIHQVYYTKLASRIVQSLNEKLWQNQESLLAQYNPPTKKAILIGG